MQFLDFFDEKVEKAAEKMKCKHCGKEQDQILFNDDPNEEVCDICFRDFFPLEQKLYTACRHAAELLYFVHGDILNSDCREDLEDVKEVESLCDTVAEVAGKLSILYTKEVKKRREEK